MGVRKSTVENMVNKNFWAGKKVFVTGNTGFKGSWIGLWLSSMNAVVRGYSLDPPTNPNLFSLINSDNLFETITGDVRDYESLSKAMNDFQPDIAIHMAAQPLVRDSYKIPVDTYEINVMGTVKFFEACRNTESLRAILNVTTDKVYENKEWLWGYRENEPFGGYDPYSNSKACSELVTTAYRNSYFNPKEYGKNHQILLATARAGNVIGGGDWAEDRLIPDIIRSFEKGKEVIIRSPNSIRPWQFVLEPLSGYLMLCEKLYTGDDIQYAEGWNFGPDESDAKTVEWIVQNISALWGKGVTYCIENYSSGIHEAGYLKLDSSKAHSILNWHPRWTISHALKKTVAWFEDFYTEKNMRNVCLDQINDFIQMKKET